MDDLSQRIAKLTPEQRRLLEQKLEQRRQQQPRGLRLRKSGSRSHLTSPPKVR